MRNRLLAAVALAPLWAVCLSSGAWAATDTISSTTTTPVSTATAVSGGPGDVDIATNGAVNPTSGAAVTINSNNVVTVEGGINISNSDNAVGILAKPGVTSSITTTGAITLNANFTPSANSDGLIQAPFASGTGRYGIETQGAFNGGIANGGTITVQGNNSYGIAVLGGLGVGSSGSASNLITGGVTLTGDHNYGVFTAGEITGSVQINGATAVQGQGSIAAATTGQIDGHLQVYSGVSATGYALTTRPSTAALLNQIQAVPAQVQQGGQALWVQGSVLGGVFLAAPPSTTVSTDTTTDADGDGVVDSVEGTAALSVTGSSPALQIGGPSAITLGQFGACNSGGAGNNCFGLIVEGSITASGVYDGVSATGADLGLGPSGVTPGVNIQGGVRVGPTGTITVSAYKANATAIQIESGLTTPILQNEGAISSSVTSSGANTAYGVLILPGASVPSFANYGSYTVGATGDSASAYAIVDRSGTMNNVVNSGAITSGVSPINVGEVTTGATVALDLHYNTTGVAFTQVNSTATPSTTGDVLLSPTGPNTVKIQQGPVTGAMSLGNNAGTSLLIDGGATYIGQLAYLGAGISINVNNGKLQNELPTVITGSNLTVGSSGRLVFAIDPLKQATVGATLAGALGGTPVLAANTQYKVGTANLASGATLGFNFLSTPAVGQTFTLIQASSLTVGGSAASLITTSPFLFTMSAQVNQAAGTVTVTATPKTPAQLGLNKAETSAYPAVFAALGQDLGIQNALINAPDSKTFGAAYQQMLPDSAGDVFQVVSTMTKATARASTGAAGFVGSGSVGAQASDEVQQSRGGLWASEFIFGMNQSRGDNEAFDAVGLGLIGGIDVGGYGATLSFASANVTKPHDPGDSIVSISQLEGGLYASPSFGVLRTDFRLAGGYLKISDRREFAAEVVSGDLSSTSSVSRTANGSWSGYDFSGRAGIGAQFDIGRSVFVQPQAHVDFLKIHEGSYGESGGGQGFDLNVQARDSTQASVTAGFVAGMRFGKGFVFKPQIELGWDQVLSGGPGNTTSRFAYGGPNFTVAPDAVNKGAGVLRLSLKGDGDYVHFDLEGGGEFRSDYQNADVRAVFRISY
jgi:hypothetical protein